RLPVARPVVGVDRRDPAAEREDAANDAVLLVPRDHVDERRGPIPLAALEELRRPHVDRPDPCERPVEDAAARADPLRPDPAAVRLLEAIERRVLTVRSERPAVAIDGRHERRGRTGPEIETRANPSAVEYPSAWEWQPARLGRPQSRHVQRFGAGVE